MGYDLNRLRRVEDALVRELGLREPDDAIRREVRMFLAMYDAATKAAPEPLPRPLERGKNSRR